MCWLGVYFVLEQLFNQTYCVRYFTKIYSVCFNIWPVNEADTMCLLIYCVKYGVNLVIEQWFNQAHCVSYFNQIHSGWFVILPVNESYTMCCIIYCVDLGYICSLKSYLSRNFVLDILLRCILVFHDMNSE